jgi:hypothetical protein
MFNIRVLIEETRFELAWTGSTFALTRGFNLLANGALGPAASDMRSRDRLRASAP